MKPTHSGLTQDQLGTIEAVLIGFNKYQIPRLLTIKKQVDAGEVLDEVDLIFLQETLHEVQSCEYFAETHEDYKTLMAEVAALYNHISHKATENQAKKTS